MAYSNQQRYGQLWLERADAVQREQMHRSSRAAATGLDWSALRRIGPTDHSKHAKKDTSLFRDLLTASLRNVDEFHRVRAAAIRPAWENTYAFYQEWNLKTISNEKKRTLVNIPSNQTIKSAEQYVKELLRSTMVEYSTGPVVPDYPQKPLPAVYERYSVSSGVANFVLRGIHANEEIAKQQLGADHRWQAIEREIPAEELGTDFLTPLVTRRLHRMFRSLASSARDEGLSSRSLSNGASWAIDVQFDIIDRFPVRPDETSEFLRALLVDVLEGARAGRQITGSWGELQVRDKNRLFLSIASPPASNDEAVSAPSTVRFTRVKRELRTR